MFCGAGLLQKKCCCRSTGISAPSAACQIVASTAACSPSSSARRPRALRDPHKLRWGQGNPTQYFHSLLLSAPHTSASSQRMTHANSVMTWCCLMWSEDINTDACSCWSQLGQHETIDSTACLRAICFVVLCCCSAYIVLPMRLLFFAPKLPPTVCCPDSSWKLGPQKSDWLREGEIGREGSAVLASTTRSVRSSCCLDK